MRILIGLILATFGVTAHAQLASLCQYSTHSDSYGRGIESAFTGDDLRNARTDETCYQLGMEAAAGAITEVGRTNCKSDFVDGFREGKRNSPNGAGVICYNLGYSAGRAALGTGAREGDSSLAPVSCIRAYKAGRADGKRGQVASPGTTSEPDAYCYLLGHFEAPLFSR